MKKILLMFALAVLLAQTFRFQTVASAQPKQAPENIQVERVHTLAGPKNCKDPQAPCTAEVFSSSIISTVSEGVFWTLMSALGGGLGFFIMQSVSSSPRVQSGIAGLVIGVITGLALFILSKNRLRQRQTAS